MTDTRKVKTDRLVVAAKRGDGWARRRLRQLDMDARHCEAERTRPRRTRAQRRAHQASRRHSRRIARQSLRQLAHSARTAG